MTWDDAAWADDDEEAEIAAILAVESRRFGDEDSPDESRRRPGYDLDHAVDGEIGDELAIGPDGPVTGLGSEAHLRDTSHTRESVADDLPPCLVPPGYFRDAAGRWRYQHGGDLVPGARDRTLARAWRFRRADGLVLVPELLAGRGFGGGVEELAWCPQVSVGARPIPLPAVFDVPGRYRRHVAAWEVPLAEWDARADVALGMEAPELSVGALIDVQGVALLAGIRPATVRSYVARGYLPAPVRTLGGSPVWSIPVVVRALARRAGQGRRSGARAS